MHQKQTTHNQMEQKNSKCLFLSFQIRHQETSFNLHMCFNMVTTVSSWPNYKCTCNLHLVTVTHTHTHTRSIKKMTTESKSQLAHTYRHI